MGNGVLRAASAALLLLALLATPADARRFRFGGFGGSGTQEKIDRVEDLPDRAPYVHDGVNWDLGWFYSTRKVVGITTSSAYDSGHYVLYNGDRYIKLDPEQLAAITADIGHDPTKAHRASNAEALATAKARAEADNASLKDNIVGRREGESLEAYRDRVRAMANSGGTTYVPPSAQTAPTRRGPAIGTALLALIVGIGLLVWIGRHLSRKQTEAVHVRGAQGHADPAVGSFDERVAARLREMHEGKAVGDEPSPAPTLAPLAVTGTASDAPAMPAPAMAGPAVRTFGRKTA